MFKNIGKYSVQDRRYANMEAISLALNDMGIPNFRQHGHAFNAMHNQSSGSLLVPSPSGY
jgi:hypothetical protein